ncbi:MAG: hypothetical protein Kow0077_20890 [Anaerolineae bacterium]
MHRKTGFVLGVLLLVLVAACTTAPAPATPTQAGEAPPAGDVTPVGDTATDTPVTEEAAIFPTPTAEELAVTDAPQGALAGVSHAAAPAGPDAYRFDSGDLVGQTGRPQLVEFFTTW